MFFKFKTSLFFLLIVLFGWIGWNSYFYFFDISSPEILIDGIENYKSYCGDLVCTVKGEHNYKISTVSVSLDGHPLIDEFNVNKKNFEHTFSVDTRSLPKDVHKLKVIAKAKSYQAHKAELEIEFNVDNIPIQAAFLKPDETYKVYQGRVLHVQFQVNKQIESAILNVFSKQFRCFPESPNSLIYECFVPVDCEEQAQDCPFSININDHVGNSLVLNSTICVASYPFRRQSIVVAPDKVKHEQEEGKDPKILQDRIEECSKKSCQEKLWRGSFCTPIEITKTTCDFGTVRTTQQKGRYMHKALDVINMPKSVVWATQDGIIVIKDRYVETGNTIVIDHGCGVLSLLCHLEEFANIQEGDKIRKGNPVGTLGMTGYATGYHLHWAMFVNNIAVDPMQWVRQSF